MLARAVSVLTGARQFGFCLPLNLLNGARKVVDFHGCPERAGAGRSSSDLQKHRQIMALLDTTAPKAATPNRAKKSQEREGDFGTGCPAPTANHGLPFVAAAHDDAEDL